MATYYFHLWTGDSYELDEIGLDLANAEEAYLEAFHGAQEIWSELLRQHRDAARFKFEVTDGEGRAIHELPFSEIVRKTTQRGVLWLDAVTRSHRLTDEVAQQVAQCMRTLRESRALLASVPSPDRPREPQS